MNNNSQYIIACLMSVFQMVVVASNISPIKFNKKEFAGIMLVSSVSSLILALLSNYLLNIIVTVVVAIFLYYKTKNLLALFIMIIIPTSVCILSNYIVVNLLALFGINAYEYAVSSFNYTLIVITSFILAFMISKAIGYGLNKNLRIIDIDVEFKSLRVIFILSIFSFGTLFFNLIYREDFYHTSDLMLASFMLQILQFTFIVYIMFQLIRTIKLEEKMKYELKLTEQLKTYTEEVESISLDMREFRHNYKNTLYTMTDYIEQGDFTDLVKYFNENIVPEITHALYKTSSVDILSNVDRRDIKGVVAAKALYAKEKKIKFTVEIKDKIGEINMYPVDMGKAIGIVLDNAIEASSDCENPYIIFGIIKQFSGVDIITKNNYIGEIPSVYQLYKGGYSTKGCYRGLGLNTLKKIISKYNNISLEISTQDKEFCLILKIADKIRNISEVV